MLCGAKSWYEIEEFGEAKESWLRQFLELPNGIPSHDTFGRVFAILNPDILDEKLREWMRCIFIKKDEKVIAIDGKTIRSACNGKGKPFVHMLSAWSCENGVSLGQIAVGEKENEITAMPKLLGMLSLKGAVVTCDAMGRQKNIAEEACKQGGDYILAVKGNQKSLLEGIQESSQMLQPTAAYTETDAGHGRVEERTCLVYRDLSMVRGDWNWKKLAGLVKVESKKYYKKDGHETKETRYYITSLNRCPAAYIATCIRQHWQEGNNLHWMLEVCFPEDTIRKAQGNAAQNFSRLNRMALAVVKNAPAVSKRCKTLKGKRFRAVLDDDYFLQALMCI